MRVVVAEDVMLTREGITRLLGLPEGLVIDDGRVRDLIGVDPLACLVPAHLGGMAERDIGHVDQHLVRALAVPDLAAGVAGVHQDGADRTLSLDPPANCGRSFTGLISARGVSPGEYGRGGLAARLGCGLCVIFVVWGRDAGGRSGPFAVR
jgi:hypothetical protein